MFYHKNYTKIALVLLVALSGPALATTLISPTDDGGFETGATFSLNGWTEINSANNRWFGGKNE